MIESNLTDNAEITGLLEITDGHVAEMLKTIRPLVPAARSDGVMVLHEIELPKNLRTTAFRWDPIFIGPADMNRMHVLETCTTYHSCGYHMMFKPDITEVLAQIDRLPDHIKLQVVAFDVLLEGVEILSNSFYGHKAKTVLYRTADDCTICHGTNGGVAGNGNIIDGKEVCDYCTCTMLPLSKR